MAKGYNPFEYMYSSARIRALESKIASRERIAHFADAEKAEGVMTQLSDFGFEPVKDGEGGGVLREDTLLGVLKTGYTEIASMECGEAIEFLRYQYDANNIKAIIKCNSRNISPDGMMIPLGNVSCEDAKTAFADKDYSAYATNMQKAIPEAEEAFATTANPQKIEFIIDRACFADMLDSAKRSGIAFAEELVVMKIDLVNIMIALRIMRMNLGKTAKGILGEAYIPGGSFASDELCETLDAGEEGLCGLISNGAYARLAEAILEKEALGTLERIADDLWMGKAKSAKYVTFGAEIAIGYIVALEYEIKNIRIVLASKDAGLAPDVIRERLRESYV